MDLLISKRHLDAKANILSIIRVLVNEGLMSKNTFDLCKSEIDRIEDNPFSLVSDIISSKGSFIEVIISGEKKYIQFFMTTEAPKQT